jgi:hypothetical protein
LLFYADEKGESKMEKETIEMYAEHLTKQFINEIHENIKDDVKEINKVLGIIERKCHEIRGKYEVEPYVVSFNNSSYTDTGKLFYDLKEKAQSFFVQQITKKAVDEFLNKTRRKQ